MAEMWTVIQSPIGDLRIVERDDAISAIEFSPFREPRADGPIGESSVHHPVLVEAARQLAAYFAQELTEFRSEEHTSELQSLMRISYAVFCLQKKTKQKCNE